MLADSDRVQAGVSTPCSKQMSPCTTPKARAVFLAQDKGCNAVHTKQTRAQTWSNFQYHTSASWPGQLGSYCTDTFGFTADCRETQAGTKKKS